MTDVAHPRPPRIDGVLAFILAVLFASGVTFCAVCAHADEGPLQFQVNSDPVITFTPGPHPSLRTNGVVPAGDELYSLGSPIDRWDGVYAKRIDVETLRLRNAGNRFNMQMDDGTSFIVDANGVSFDGLHLIDERRVWLYLCGAAALGAIGGGAFFSLISATLFGKALSERRFAARLHRSLYRKMVENDPGGGPARGRPRV